MKQALSESEQELLSLIAPLHDGMLSNTRALCEINSGSHNREGINRVNQRLIELFQPLADHVEQRPLAPIQHIADNGDISHTKTAEALIFTIRPDAPLTLLCTGHSDTVFSQSSDFQTTWIDDKKQHLRGPGVADMKGGLMVMLSAIKAIHASPYQQDIGFIVVISPDEEIGSPSSAQLLGELAQKADYGLTFEPALADGTLAGARKGSGNFSLIVKGKSSHAGRDFWLGSNAVVAAAQAAFTLASLSDKQQGITLNVGKISGGGPNNIVPDTAVCRFNVRITEEHQQDKIIRKIRAIINTIAQESGCAMSLEGNFHRPVKAMNERQVGMFELLKSCGSSLDLDISWKPTGGCCEGNNLAGAGLINIDTLGVRGGHIHSSQEFACIDSFTERAELCALLMARLIQHKRYETSAG